MHYELVAGYDTSSTATGMPIIQSSFGQTSDGQDVLMFTLTNGEVTVRVINYGSAIVSIEVPDRNKRVSDVVLGFDNIEGYEGKNPYFGATIGRVSGRIERGRFTLNGETHQLTLNDGPNHVHGGMHGFDKKIFEASVVGDSLKLVYVSPDGEEGYPGELTLAVTYTLREGNGLVIEYHARTTKPTPISVMDHSLFNLAGHDSGSLYDHTIQIPSEEYVECDEKTFVSKGRMLPVEGTIYDLRQPTLIGDRIKGASDGVYVATYKHPNQSMDFVCTRLVHPGSGRVLEVMTDNPAIQLYTGFFLDGSVRGKQGHSYPKHGAVCLALQRFPNAINQPSLPSCVLEPGDVYKSTTIYKFSVLH